MLADIWTVFWRDWVVLKHRMTAFILSRMVAPLLYLIAFGWGLGRSIQTASGGSYIDFLVPGILPEPITSPILFASILKEIIFGAYLFMYFLLSGIVSSILPMICILPSLA